jgi:signal transduction histidine kinase
MDLAKASYDPNEISFSELRLDEILLESYTKIVKENSGYKVSLNIDDAVEEQQLIIQGNEYLLQVAFNNLIDNACKYSPEHICSIDVRTNSKILLISFANIGNIIPKEDLEHIFKPFYRSETSRQEKGHGIGLFLTEKIILLHHAKITVVSDHNETVFTVIFDII